ncbi:uncharacterized protein Z518_05026 [Rhinocladiella mackenziei CBS 650.93]|uniref:Rhinocladiella mackenziei CBS 650.93 unplaced genomic scaffold supercont1.3, whole genome shotgun sequence n=1 Tax=Rhinocladiella mackenziei CBS 650.93 TaxID=1442369 RepID=A0A0D2IMQ9_9EURO|nr:uncharacterized protein Z518_05026 [Rhinocladiella mackenziei CBS 650.93]KIX07049.1 hypothetical protein Z518_05026 [Rhinocladiella mackenziei CBS 650.93]
MGLKRKASVLEDTVLQTDPNTSPVAPSSTASSSPSSTFTPTSSNANLAHPYQFWKIDSVPYLNTRTRKRYRDARPDEGTIHENTLKKLYDAQRLHLDEAMSMSEVIWFEERDGQIEEDADMIDEPEIDLPQSAQQNQRTIEAFFSGKGGSQTKASRWETTHVHTSHLDSFRQEQVHS